MLSTRRASWMTSSGRIVGLLFLFVVLVVSLIAARQVSPQVSLGDHASGEMMLSSEPHYNPSVGDTFTVNLKLDKVGHRIHGERTAVVDHVSGSFQEVRARKVELYSSDCAGESGSSRSIRAPSRRRCW